MKKLLSILLSILLVSTLVFTVTACNDSSESESIDETVTPVTITVESSKEDGVDVNTLTEISLSAAAKTYVDNREFDKLAALFTAHNIKGFTIDATKATVKFEIPAEVTHIATNAITNLTFITDLVVHEKVVEIEKGAFVGLSGLKSITLPFVGSKVGAINGAKLFAYIFGSIGGDGLTAVTQTYNDGTESTESLYVPTSLKTVTVTGAVDAKETSVSYYINKEDNKHVPVEAGTTEGPNKEPVYTITTLDYSASAVQPYAFYGITTIETVNLPENTKIIPEYTFYGCTGIKALSFADGVVIGKYAYTNCTSLRDLTLGAVTIGEGAFSGCTYLGKDSEVDFGGLDVTNVVEFGKDSFAGCTSLTKDNLVKLELSDTATPEEITAYEEYLAKLAEAFGKEFFEEDDDDNN